MKVILLVLSSAVLMAQQGPPAFKAETNLVLVPVVVRDAKGEAVANLTKEDFKLFDNGKLQTIASFSVEETSGQVAQNRSMPDAKAPAAQTNSGPMVIPARYVALLFDDQHFKDPYPGGTEPPGYIGDPGDLMFAREAARKLIRTLKPADRVGVFTSTGAVSLDFTDDREKIEVALLKLRTGKPVPILVPYSVIDRDVENQADEAIRTCESVVRRMAYLPGQRTVVFISPGLLTQGTASGAWSESGSTMNLIDSAIRSRVVINSLDARGLSPRIAGSFAAFQERVTDGTGGTFIRDNNDLKGSMERLAATPKYIYVLGFSPQDIKRDGSFHRLKVQLQEGKKLDVHTRAGYQAPDPKDLTRKQSQPATLVAVPQLSKAETQQVALALGIAADASNAPAQLESASIRPSTAETTVSALAPAMEKSKTTAGVSAPTAPSKNDEIITTEQPATFKVQTNLVEVPVIVRDRGGHAVGNLKQADFHILDKGKRQEIAKFAIVKAARPADSEAQARVEATTPAVSPTPSVSPANPPAVPTRFIAFVFDDLHMRIDELPQVRAAVQKYLSTSIRPGDRIALVTTSGQHAVDFTDDLSALSSPIDKIAPSPLAVTSLSGCGAYVSYFQAVQIDREVGLHPLASDVSKSLALRVAVTDFGYDNALQVIRDAYTSGLQESRNTLAALRAVVRRMVSMPGQRSVVLVSPGFFVPYDLQHESDELMSQAIHEKVLINIVDARGAWTNPVYSGCSKGASADIIRDVAALRDLEGHANTDELIAIAEDTGGASNFNNDFFGGVRKAAAAPEYLYILGFVPQDLKLDGSFHALKVSVGSGEKLTLQARRGYWAPKHAEDEAAVSKQEIENAVFSRDEVNGLPVDMHTRLTKVEDQVKLTVLTSVDLKAIQLRKVDDRNRNELRIVAALFDTNGNFLMGNEKLLQLRLRDETVAGLPRKPPITIATDFDVKPGSYLVRLVVRDAEGQQITAENAAVQVQ